MVGWVSAHTSKTVPTVSAPDSLESFESRLGSQIFNRIAIVLLLIGTAYGLKLAVDRGLIGPTGRVILGLLAGAGLVLWSERFRRNGFAAFSYSLKAVGSGVLYLSLWAAFQLFHLLPAGAALTLMILVTAWNAYMAWVQDSELLAAYALAGGFATPMLVSTGGNHEIFLFTYLLAIDVATVALVRLKTWPRLLLGAFPITAVFFIGWYSEFYATSELTVTSIFVVLFGMVFASVPLGRDVEGAGSTTQRSASVATVLSSEIGEPAQVERVLGELGESFLNFQVVAKREAEQRGELSAVPDVVATVPYMDSDIFDLAGLLAVGEQLWR